MKIGLLTDSHWGARGDHLGFLDYFEKFHNEIFFPVLEQRGISHIIHLGDLVDRRKYINYYTASRLRRSFIDRLDRYNCTIIAGNHDVYHRNTNDVNALKELVEGKANVITEPSYYQIADYYKPFLMIPWINRENKVQSTEMIKNSYANYCFGHLQLSGFEMHIGTTNDDGQEPSMYSKFDGVYSGHYHHKSSRNNIHYLGSPYEITWNDYADPRGFHIFDCITGELEFIQNPNTMFHKIVYNDTNSSLNKLLDVDFTKFNKKYVKVILLKKNNPYWFEKFFDEIEKNNPYDLNIVEDHLNLGIEDDPDLVEKAQDTFTILKGYVDSMDSQIDKPKLTKLLKELYDEALLIET